MSGDNLSTLPPRGSLPEGGLLWQRVNALVDQFRSSFSHDPQVIFRVPGRVNLIGEHIDYCGYSVCPMALQQDVLLAASSSISPPFLHVVNTNKEKYPEQIIDSMDFEINIQEKGWAAYVLCGVKGALTRLDGWKITNLRFAVSGNIPPGSGLSSSSALVCASLLASTYLHKCYIPKYELATLSANCERFIGTAGGGMDQAIAFLATKGCAKLIDFNPLHVTDVVLPSKAVFVIAHSLVTKNKAESSDFNIRVTECRLATQVLAHHLKVDRKKYKCLADLQKGTGVSLDKIIDYAQDILHNQPYTKSEICAELDVTEDELNSLIPPDVVSLNHFKLRQRALHVFQEARRVREWCRMCKSGVCDLTDLGLLLTDSHLSLRDQFEVSHPQVDQLVRCCLDAGAYGARMTGAGWGGCVVALVAPESIGEFVSSVTSKFYSGEADVSSYIFVTEPNGGAEIFPFTTSKCPPITE